MKLTRKIPILLLLLLWASISVMAEDSGRIYGKIVTTDGDEFEGLIRWDKNEGSWVDVLDGNKELSKRHAKRSKKSRKKYRDRESSIEFFGIKIGKTGSYCSGHPAQAQSGIRFGHIKRIEVIDDNSVIVQLKSGEEVELVNGSTDIGSSIRELVIEDEREGEIELIWDDIDFVEFSETPRRIESTFGDRLYGTLITRRGDEYTGYVCWDVDELFTLDILDGDQKRRTRKIKFGKIKAIERYSSSGATVTLANGDDILLKESNDVDDGNRGIIISDPAFGQVVVAWDEFERLDFSPLRTQTSYNAFDGGKALSGTVYDEDGESYSGKIRWDNDEEFTWEILDGNFHDVAFDIEFGLIRKIEKKSHRSSLVTVSDGRVFRLRGSNDVDGDNKGIFVMMSDGEEIEVNWEDFDYVDFD